MSRAMTFRSSAVLHPSPVLCSLWCQLQIKPRIRKHYGQRKRVDVFGLQFSLMQLKFRRCCFLSAVDLRKERKKREMWKSLQLQGQGRDFIWLSVTSLFTQLAVTGE